MIVMFKSTPLPPTRLVFLIMVADIIKIENLPTFSGQKTDMLIGFSVVGLAKNNLSLMN